MLGQGQRGLAQPRGTHSQFWIRLTGICRFLRAILIVQDFSEKAVFLLDINYWDVFTKSGSIEDYLAFCAHRPELQNDTIEVKPYAPENTGIDSQRTEYR